MYKSERCFFYIFFSSCSPNDRLTAWVSCSPLMTQTAFTRWSRAFWSTVQFRTKDCVKNCWLRVFWESSVDEIPELTHFASLTGEDVMNGLNTNICMRLIPLPKDTTTHETTLQCTNSKHWAKRSHKETEWSRVTTSDNSLMANSSCYRAVRCLGLLRDDTFVYQCLLLCI